MIYHYIVLVSWMIFMHVFADFCLQGILANLKQRSWWEQNCPDEMYKDDYMIALVLHSFSWSFCIQLPILIYTWGNINWVYAVMLLVNTFIHELVDNLKANENISYDIVVNSDCEELIKLLTLNKHRKVWSITRKKELADSYICDYYDLF